VNLYKVQTDKKQTHANKQTNKQTNNKKISALYIRFQSTPHRKKHCVSITKAKKLIMFKKISFSSYKTYIVGKMRRF
jgi:hypothetical protein